VLSLLAILIECQNATVPAPTWQERLIPFLPTLAPVVLIFTFWLGWRQRESERCFSFYHQVVISPSMKDVEEFFETYRKRLTEQAMGVPSDEARATTSRDLTILYREFSDDLYKLKDALIRRIEVFDTNAAKQIALTTDDLDTEITKWVFSRAEKTVEALDGLLPKSKRSLIRCVYKGQTKILR
jgi:hypothetical protein